MSAVSQILAGSPAFSTSLGPSSTPGGFSGQNTGTPSLSTGFGFPSYGDPSFYFQPAASSFNINKLLGFANGSAVNINVGPTPPTLGLGGLLLGMPFNGVNESQGNPLAGAMGSFGAGIGPFFGSPVSGLVDPTGGVGGGLNSFINANPGAFGSNAVSGLGTSPMTSLHPIGAQNVLQTAPSNSFLGNFMKLLAMTQAFR